MKKVDWLARMTVFHEQMSDLTCSHLEMFNTLKEIRAQCEKKSPLSDDPDETILVEPPTLRDAMMILDQIHTLADQMIDDWESELEDRKQNDPNVYLFRKDTP